MEQYKTALEHISVRAGTAIPTGAAEGALAALYQRREEAWPFLAEHLTADDLNQNEEQRSRKIGVRANGTEDRKGDVDGEGEPSVASETDGVTTATTDRTGQHEESGTGQHHQRPGRAREKKRSDSTTSSGEGAPELFSLARLSVALEEFACACEERGDALEGLAVQDLMKFLYLGGQARVSFLYVGVLEFGTMLRTNVERRGDCCGTSEGENPCPKSTVASSGCHSVLGRQRRCCLEVDSSIVLSELLEQSRCAT